MDHQYCLFYKNSRLQFGWIQEVRKNKLVVIPETGKEFNCSVKQTELIWKGKEYIDSKEALAYLKNQSEWVNTEKSNIDLNVIHELCEHGIAYSIDDLAGDFLDEPENGWSKVSLLLALKESHYLFQQKKEQFFARSEEDIQRIKEKEEKEKEQALRQEKESTWAEELLKGVQPELDKTDEAHWKQFLGRLEKFVVYQENAQEKGYFTTLFHCDSKDPMVNDRKLLDTLNTAGVPLSWGKLTLKRSSAILEFSKEEIQAADQLAKQQNEKGGVRDQTHLETYTIDNAETLDYDDALSWEENEEGTYIRIHITNVASFIGSESPLFKTSEHKISSLYTLKEVIPMLPPVLSEDYFSLREACIRDVVTYEIFLDHDGNEKTDIYRSQIEVNQNLSYQQVDQYIEEKKSFWPELSEYCQSLKQKRLENGALDFDRVEVKLDISNPENIEIKDVRENTPASTVVQELAIYTNFLSAQFCMENDLLCLYRNQKPYQVTNPAFDEMDAEDRPKLQLSDIQIYPAYIGIDPDGHSGLGLTCYSQTTSPIRRFHDLINQQVLLNGIDEKNSEFEEDDLLLWAKRGEELQREYSQIERSLLEHWKIKYLSQHRDDSFAARKTRTLRNGRSLINILKLQLNLVADFDEVDEGEEIKVYIETIHPEIHKVVLRQSIEN